MPALDRLAEDAVGRQNLPGVAVAVVHAGQVIASAAAGFADLAARTPMSAGSACNWFSMTKIATATAAMVLAEGGALDLNAPVARYLGEVWPGRPRARLGRFPCRAPRPAAPAAIRARHRCCLQQRRLPGARRSDRRRGRAAL